MRVQIWLKVKRSITYNAVTNGTQIHTDTDTDTQTHRHTSQLVQRNDEYKILWNFNIQTDKVTEYRLPDIT